MTTLFVTLGYHLRLVCWVTRAETSLVALGAPEVIRLTYAIQCNGGYVYIEWCNFSNFYLLDLQRNTPARVQTLPFPPHSLENRLVFSAVALSRPFVFSTEGQHFLYFRLVAIATDHVSVVRHSFTDDSPVFHAPQDAVTHIVDEVGGEGIGMASIFYHWAITHYKSNSCTSWVYIIHSARVTQ